MMFSHPKNDINTCKALGVYDTLQLITEKWKEELKVQCDFLECNLTSVCSHWVRLRPVGGVSRQTSFYSPETEKS